MATADLERQLRELGGEIAYPRTPNLARAVRARIRPQPAWRRWRVALAAAAVLLIAVAGAVALNPDARRTVAGYLGLPGFQIRKVQVLPSPSPFHGTRAVTLAEAGKRVRVYDGRHVAEGASGRNGGFALRGGAMPYDRAREWLGADRAAGYWRLTEQHLDRLLTVVAFILRTIEVIGFVDEQHVNRLL